jgi:Fe2+ or Zn2+ uptake regulation protein
LLLFFDDADKLDYAKARNNRAMICLNQGHNVFGCNDVQKASELENCEILGAAKSTAVSFAFSNF